MKLFGLTVVSLASADVTQYNDANGNTITIDPGCPTLWPKNQDKDTVLPYWKGECPPIDLCYPNILQHVGTKPYNAPCRDADGNKVVSSACCSIEWDKGSYCYGSCDTGAASNLDNKSKVNWRCSCSRSKGCWWVIQGNNMSDLVCTPCKAAQRINWTTSGTQQADFNNQPPALGVNGKILSAGWIHKNADNAAADSGNYHIVLSIQGVTLDASNVMAWDYDVETVVSEPHGANQWYTFAQTFVVLTPNSHSPKGENWSNGDQTDILIGIENYDDFTQANIDAGVVAYSVGIIYDRFEDDGVTPLDFECALSHFGANPGKNDMQLSDLQP